MNQALSTLRLERFVRVGVDACSPILHGRGRWVVAVCGKRAATGMALAAEHRPKILVEDLYLYFWALRVGFAPGNES